MNRFLAILFCVLVSWGAHGETHELVFRNLNMSQGISDNYVRSILRDKFGMMWFVTLNGLNRFDGYRFKKYDVGHDPYWNDALYHVWEDADSNIWVTGASYVYAYHRASDCIDTRVQGVLAAYGMPGKGAGGDAPAPEGLFVDEDRNLWCLYGSTLFCYDFVRRRLAKVRMEPGLKLHYLACRGGKARLLCSDSGGRGGVWSVDLRRGEMSRVVPTGHGVGEESRLYVDSRGRFWHYNLHEEGLFLLDESGLEWRDAAANSLLCGKMITAMMDDCDGNLWIGTDNDGIFFMDAQTLRVEDVRCRQGTSFSLTDKHVASFYMDDEFSTVWVGMSKQGVAFCNMKQPAISFVRMQGMEDVSCIAEDRDDRLWFGFDSQGIGCFDGTVMRHIS